MSIYVPQWVGTDTTMSAAQLMQPAAANAYTGNPIEPYALKIKGVDGNLGAGEFIFAQLTNAAGCLAGDVCELTPLLVGTTSISLATGAQQWAGTTNSGKPLCIALATLTQGQWGWFQIYGNALINASGAIAASVPLYWASLGKVQAAAVASKQLTSAMSMVAVSASFGTAVGGVTPTLTTQVIAFISFPTAEDAIT